MRSFKVGALINGAWVTHTASLGSYNIVNPATNDVLATVPKCGIQETQQAISTAHETFATYKKTTGYNRAQSLRLWAQSVQTHKAALAEIITKECGKPLTEAVGEVAYSCDYINWFAGEAERIYGDVIPSARPETRQLVIRQPV
eukprot:PhF_6_TR13680/c0_g1_i2/m.22010/K00135/gabD; succinate-semialdehyde dehydrogenase / glutarate-semialdehyde dehydrogenase